jgi:ribosomal protein L35
MNVIFYILLLLTFVVCKADNILFIGNSLTTVNCFPCKFKRFAKKRYKIKNYTSTKRSVNLLYHAHSSRTKKQARRRNYKAIILQEQSQLLSDYRYHESGVAYFANNFRHVYLLQNWSQRTGYYANLQFSLLRNSESIAKRYKIKHIPVGYYWLYVYIFVPDLWMQLYKDDRHPSAMGSYLTGCIVYKTVYNVTNVPDIFKPRSISDKNRKTLLNVCNK